MFKIGDEIRCLHASALRGNVFGPTKLVIGNHYFVKNIILDSAGNQHLDIGMESPYNFIRSYDTKEYLPDGHKIQWVHPSRFIKVQ